MIMPAATDWDRPMPAQAARIVRIGAAHTGTVVGRQHHDALDDFGFLFGDQSFVPQKADNMGNFVAFIDEFGGRIAVVTGLVTAVIADRGTDQRGHHDFIGLHRLFNTLRQLRQYSRFDRLLDLTGLQ